MKELKKYEKMKENIEDYMLKISQRQKDLVHFRNEVEAACKKLDQDKEMFKKRISGLSKKEDELGRRMQYRYLKVSIEK